MVGDPGVLIQAHDSEECIEDLVQHLCPLFSIRVFCDSMVEEPSHEEEEKKKACYNKEEPD